MSLERYFLCIKKTSMEAVGIIFGVLIGYYGLIGNIVVAQNLVIAIIVMIIAIMIAFIYERTGLLES